MQCWPQVPDYLKPKEGFIVHAEIEVEVPCEHGLLVENLLDLAHAPFTHQVTFSPTVSLTFPLKP